MKKLINEFKHFAFKGNVIDLAVGVVIGSSFGKIITSLVSDIIMPLVSLLTGKTNFNELSIVLREAAVDQNNNVIQNALTWNYGSFIQTVIDFLIIALCIFAVVKTINHTKKSIAKKEKIEKEAEKEPSSEEKLLTEIRDLLKGQADGSIR